MAKLRNLIKSVGSLFRKKQVEADFFDVGDNVNLSPTPTPSAEAPAKQSEHVQAVKPEKLQEQHQPKHQGDPAIQHQHKEQKVTPIIPIKTAFAGSEYFPGVGLSPDEIHKASVYEAALKETRVKGYYVKAKKALAPVPYSVENRGAYKFADGYTVFSHLVSGGLSLVAVAIGAYMLSGLYNAPSSIPRPLLYLSALLIGAILFGLLAGSEVLKASQANKVFRRSAAEEEVEALSIFALVCFILVNIGWSAGGGWLLSARMNDRTADIEAIYTVQRDSINKTYSQQITSVQGEIDATNATKAARAKRSAAWGLTEDELKVLAKNKDAQQGAIAAQQKALEALSTTKVSQITENNEDGSLWALYGAIFAVVLELLAVWAYYYKYDYLAKCKIEDANHNITPSPTVSAPSVTAAPVVVASTSKEDFATEFAKAFALALAHQQQQNHQQQRFNYPPATIEYEKGVMPTEKPTRVRHVVKSEKVQPQQSENKIDGGQFDGLRNPSIDVKQLSETAFEITRNGQVTIVNLQPGQRLCERCYNAFPYNSPTHRFCSNSCKSLKWQQNNPDKVAKNKQKSAQKKANK